jgi:hypothetical protein
MSYIINMENGSKKFCTTLVDGKRSLLASLGGLPGLGVSGLKIANVAFGVGGVTSSGVVLSVDENLKTFIGGSINILEFVPAQCAMSDDSSCLEVTAMLPSNLERDGVMFNQIGLQLSNGLFYAIATFSGFEYNQNVECGIKWSVEL